MGVRKNFKIKEPRLITSTRAECRADPVLFMPWEEMPKAAKAEFTNNGPIPCEGGGVPGFWCDQCRFGTLLEPEEIDENDY